SSDVSYHRPFTLNRKQLSYILVYGDGDDRLVTKILWAAIASTDIKIENANTIEALKQLAPDSLLTVVFFQSGDKSFDIGLEMANSPEMVGHVMGITHDATTEDRIRILASGYDSVFNLEMVSNAEFPDVIRHKIEK